MGSKNKVKKLKVDGELKKSSPVSNEEAKEYVGTLQKLQEKDPEFYEFLKEHDKELLEFDEEDTNDDFESDGEEEETQVHQDDNLDGEAENEEEPSKNIITIAMVDSWCAEIQCEKPKIGAIRSLLRAFRAACHYGDDNGDDPTTKYSTMSSSVFNKIMLVVLTEMDGLLRGLLKLPASGGKKEAIIDLMTTRKWKNYNHLVKSYLGNSLHVLNQMTDNEMIAFMLRRLKYSSVFLAAFPALLRKYVKVALHFWGTGSGALPIVSFLFLRDSCVRLGSDCLDDCIKGMYKAFVVNCHFINATKLQHIQFLSNCFSELLRVDISLAYQHAFVYIRQLAMILKEALSGSTKKNKTKKGEGAPPSSTKKRGKETPSSSASKKETFRKVYQWKYINCLELWTGVVCAYSSEADLRPLAYPLTQIITGTARLLPSACYFPVRLRCVKMLNRISASTGSFIPVSLLLLDMLEIKELRKPPSGGVGKAVDLLSTLKVSKASIKTRAFQEACVFTVIEELAEHLAQWSYSIAFLELSFVCSVRLRNFCKATKVEWFRREMRHLIQQIEANSDFMNKKRTAISFLPNDPTAASFLEDEKKLCTSPLSKYIATLRQRAQDRSSALMESSVLVGDHSSKFGNNIPEEDDSEDEKSAGLLLLGPDSKNNLQEDLREDVKTKKNKPSEEVAVDEDIIGDFILSSDEEGDDDDDAPDGDDSEVAAAPKLKQRNKKRNPHLESSKPRNSKSKKRKRTQGR